MASLSRALSRTLSQLSSTSLACLLLTTAHAETAPSAAQLNNEAREQRIFEARIYLADRARLERVTYALLQAASPYCVNNRKYSIGAPPVTPNDLPEDLRLGYLYSLGANASTQARFLHVPPRSPLRVAAVKEGDLLLSTVDAATHKTIKLDWVFNRPSNTLVQNETISLEVSNEHGKRTLKVRPQLICEVRPALLRQDDLVARIGQGKLSVSTGLLRFASNDDDLATLLAHELAHSITPSATKPQSDKDAPRYTQEEEQAADYLGAYIAVLSGVNLENSKDIWRRIASNPPSQAQNGIAHSHPFSSQRALWQLATRQEIDRKNRTGLPMAPDPQRIPYAVGQTAPAANNAEDLRLYDVASVPFIRSEGRTGYQRFLDSPLRPRAFAISQDGAWSYKTGANAAADALNLCGDKTDGCYLYAVDDRVVWNPATAMHLPQPSIKDSADPRLSKVEAVPLIDAAGRAAYTRFLNLTVRPRAFAIGPNNTGPAAWAFQSGPNASADALARCAVRTSGRPCYLYALDDNVVWTFDSAPLPSFTPPTASTGTRALLRTPPASGYADINALGAVPLHSTQQTSYRAFLEKPVPRAFVITSKGDGRYWLGAEAMSDALIYCERLGEPCWLYAVDNDVVWHEDSAKRISKRAQLPRQSEESEFLK